MINSPGCHEERWVRRTRTWGGDLVDICATGGWMTKVQPSKDTVPRLESGDKDAGGRLVLPGLWDHHVHAEQWAESVARVPLGTAHTPDDVIAAMADALARRGGRAPLWGFGFHGVSWLHQVDAALLDQVSSTVPIVAISGDWHSVWLNTPALELARSHMAISGTGVVREDEWFELSGRLATRSEESIDHLVAEAVARAATRGITGIVDMERGEAWRKWRRRLAGGLRGIRVSASVWEEGLDEVLAEGLRTGDPLIEGETLGTMGPLKVIADGALGSRTAACRAPYPNGCHGWVLKPATELAELLAKAAAGGIHAAVHAIGDRAAGEVLRAFSASGATGSIEHAQLLEGRDIRRMATQRLVASVQPEHAMDDRDAVEELWASRAAHAFRFADMAAAGIRLAFGSDAPIAPLDPWQAISAAVFRTRDGREPWRVDQRLPLDLALAASMPARAILEPPSARLVPRPGDPADVIVTEADPRDLDAEQLRAMPVAATMVAGEWTHEAW